MNTCISIKRIALGKLLESYKLILKGNQEIIKAAQKRYSTWSSLNRIVQRIVFKELNNNKNKWL